jgi:hypothetical protein
MLGHYGIVTERDVPDVIRKRLVAGAGEWQRLGVTPARLRSLTRSGELARVWHGVYSTRAAVEWAKTNPARGHALRVMAACASVGRDSTASHQSAALIHGLDLFPAAPNMVFLTRPQARRSSRLRSDGVCFHTAELPDEHVTRIFGMRVTTVARTVVDLARTSPFQSAVVTADSALRADLTTKAALVSVCSACAGWPGVRQARRAVEFSDPRAESVLESCARVIFEEHGIEPPDLQTTLTGPNFRYSVDFSWPRHRVIAEADGEVKYSNPRRAIRQLERDQQLRDLGYTVIHFTWRELFQNPAAVIARIRKALTATAPL